jgi:hypothetical protein
MIMRTALLFSVIFALPLTALAQYPGDSDQVTLPRDEAKRAIECWNTRPPQRCCLPWVHTDPATGQRQEMLRCITDIPGLAGYSANPDAIVVNLGPEIPVPAQNPIQPPNQPIDQAFVGSWASKIGVTVVLNADHTGNWVDSRPPGPMQGGGSFSGTWNAPDAQAVTLELPTEKYGSRGGSITFNLQPSGSLRDPWGNEYSK